MDIKNSTLNAASITAELNWLRNVIQCRFDLYWHNNTVYNNNNDNNNIN